MPDTKVLTNQRYAHFAGPSTAIPAANWASGPTLDQVQTLLNISEATRIDGTDFNLESSDTLEDRAFTDAAGSQSRSFNQASGNIEIYTPASDTDASIYGQTWNALSKSRTRLAIGQRPVKASTSAIAAGDEINLFSAITDDRVHNRNDTIRTLGIGLLPQGDILVNYIVPATVPTALTVTPQGGAVFTAAPINKPLFVKVTYQGRNITNGAKYVSSDETKLIVRNGVLVPLAVGTVTLTVSYPGAATLAPISVTVTAS